MDKKQKEEQQVLLNEEKRKSMWERTEARWAKKAKKEGWSYTPKTYISEAERQAAARKERIAALKSELKQLLTEEEKESLFASIKAEHLD